MHFSRAWLCALPSFRSSEPSLWRQSGASSSRLQARYCRLTDALSCDAVLAYLVAALSPNMEVANAALPTYVVTLLFFAGFLLRWKNIPNYWKW